MGAADIRLLARNRERDENGQYKKRNKHAGQGVRTGEKESYRRIAGGLDAKGRLAGVWRVTVVQNREGDICESFCQLREAGVDFVIRSNHDRKIRGEAEGTERLCREGCRAL
jgi:hypothetical protein